MNNDKNSDDDDDQDKTNNYCNYNNNNVLYFYRITQLTYIISSHNEWYHLHTSDLMNIVDSLGKY